ncbi:hypothetical protein EU537_01825 [Candidatus Thorarchaeota archaeon]|nr:MAG: hypothetical protein EU537_01825 [Candidatus Thorarchaeota archaeon]
MSDNLEDTNRLSRFLVIFGAILTGLHGVLYLMNFGRWLRFLPTIELGNILGSLTSLGIGVLLIFLSIITLAISSSLIELPISKSQEWIPLLLIGLLMYFLGGTLGGLLVIMGSLLKLI